ncbi:MAG: Glutamate racemase, partial [Anaerolinea thermophila]
TVVMGCTHYPFVIPVIEEITGPAVRTIDPAPAVARQVRRLLMERSLLNLGESGGKLHFYTSGDLQAFVELHPKLLGEAGDVQQVKWNDRLHLSE